MSGSSLVQIIVMPALVIFFCICLWISNRLGWIVNPFTAYLLPPRPGEAELERPVMWDVYTRYRGVKDVDEVTWPQIKVRSSAPALLERQLSDGVLALRRDRGLRAGADARRGHHRHALAIARGSQGGGGGSVGGGGGAAPHWARAAGMDRVILIL